MPCGGNIAGSGYMTAAADPSPQNTNAVIAWLKADLANLKQLNRTNMAVIGTLAGIAGISVIIVIILAVRLQKKGGY